MTTLFYREGRLLALSILMAVVLGVTAFATIGRQEDPTITNLFATIVTPFPGADPGRVEALVTEKIEAELREIPEIKNIDSVSRTGVSSVQVELSEFTPKDRIEQVWSEVRDALADAVPELPAGAPEPDFDNDRVGAFTSIAALTAADPDRPPSLAVLSRFAEDLQDRLRRIGGTELVNVYGAAEEEILVEVDPDRLAALGVSAAQVSAAIAAADVKAPAGRVRGEQADYVLEVAGEIDGLARVREIPIALAGGDAFATVGDVAEVSRSQRAPDPEIARLNGGRVVLVAARMEPDLQVDAYMARLRAELDAFEAELPTSLALNRIFDQSEYTFERLTTVATNMAIGVAIVVAVLLVTLGWRSALIVGSVLPLASLLSLVILQYLGIVVHQMSVTGMIVALGLLVDAAIVITDDIRRRLAAGADRLHAVDQSVRRLAAPLLASTVTTILAFVPMAVLPGPAGDFVGSIAISVMVMLISSFLLALTVTPALAGRLLRRGDPDAPARRLNWLQRLYRRSLEATLRYRVAALAVAASPAIVGFAAFPTLTAQFFPGVDRDQFYIQVTLSDGSAISETARAVDAIDALLRDIDEVEDVAWVLGRSAPAFYYNMQPDQDRAPNFAEALVTVADEETAARLTASLQGAVDAAAPQAQAIVRRLVQGPPVAAPLEMRLVGPSVEILREIGEEARARMQELPTVTHARADLSGGAPKLVFELDEEKVRAAGLDLGVATSQLLAQLEGATGGSLVEGSEELPVRVRVGDAERGGADQVMSLMLTPPGAAQVSAAGGFAGAPLSAFGEMRLAPGDTVIARRNGERINTVQAFLPPDVLPEEALRDLQERLAADPLELPAGYRIEWGGDSDARGETVNNLMSSVALVVALSVATIVLTFNSWRLSAIAFVAAGLSMGLSLLALEIMQFPFGINALIGVIGSVGVSINAAIIIMSALRDDPAAATGAAEPVVDVVMNASRHIVSTTVTTFGGFLPLIVGGGLFWPPFATAVAGGVLLSTVVSLYFTPPLFSLLAGRRGYGASAAKPAAKPAATPAGSGAAAAPA